MQNINRNTYISSLWESQWNIGILINIIFTDFPTCLVDKYQDTADDENAHRNES